ncbi:mitochondrial lysine-tRNA synthetase [Exophiala xenobiotica]|uniref:Mitochondrial lysine-tRNA synthetase n=1 Tax=Vermiconidia calcicola TaxID=1690605 RepID=A0AAV9PVY5_9PEZI|nr:mitochondrial lysine-tRNA synthetase [Exophiala xenobiotica]KAK5530579.1 mitochondrial lysine-tRNA synthetase [Vermiconidia calcicola]KAK5532195.1 mitochondrial lysine-tRNA synthetase [Chaetothyriales sp. CCFEE 6169]KAK5267805.1 mitochondrial lysine-tRNA synthetase [Exophiala xenobiotica]KAK5294343.1 mitochondrial lysine-tRNA synthetase [Exophiala xenobiotica]
MRMLCSSKEAEERMQELEPSGTNLYPRYTRDPCARDIRTLVNEFKDDAGGDIPAEDATAAAIEVSGRITSIRLSGSKLVFLDLVQDQRKLQVTISYAALNLSSVTLDTFKHHVRLIRRGDYISIRGTPPFRSKNGQITIKATTLPVLQSPCLQRFPVEQPGYATDETAISESNFTPRHVEMLTDPDLIHTLKARSSLVRSMRSFFEQRHFVEVSTPILSASAGGATAKPFETTATEFDSRKLSLRIAPELPLKRLIIGGMDRIFEIGPCFRNEGLDKTHNPEFHTCEFYAVGHDLPRLMTYTHQLLKTIADGIEALPTPPSSEQSRLLLQQLSENEPFRQFDFLPALNAALRIDLPNLSSPEAQKQLLEIFKSKDLPVPTNPTVPRLVDKLAALFIEPESLERPIWITNIPECLSPLAKSYTHPTAPNAQPVAARAELFIQGKEVVNCYEEENSPFEQRRKFVEQQRLARQNAGEFDEEAMTVDEEYIQALEWGLPPTGGWGCGIDRLVMLFTGRERIGDVLSFGNLRAVTRGAEKKPSES